MNSGSFSGVPIFFICWYFYLSVSTCASSVLSDGKRDLQHTCKASFICWAVKFAGSAIEGCWTDGADCNEVIVREFVDEKSKQQAW